MYGIYSVQFGLLLASLLSYSYVSGYGRYQFWKMPHGTF